jgi:hypothetical protein
MSRPPEMAAETPRRARVLIVEDEPLIAENLRTALAEPAEPCLSRSQSCALRTVLRPRPSFPAYLRRGARRSPPVSRKPPRSAPSPVRDTTTIALSGASPRSSSAPFCGAEARARSIACACRRGPKRSAKTLRPPSGGRRHLRSAQELSAFPSDEQYCPKGESDAVRGNTRGVEVRPPVSTRARATPGDRCSIEGLDVERNTGAVGKCRPDDGLHSTMPSRRANRFPFQSEILTLGSGWQSTGIDVKRSCPDIYGLRRIATGFGRLWSKGYPAFRPLELK